MFNWLKYTYEELLQFYHRKPQNGLTIEKKKHCLLHQDHISLPQLTKKSLLLFLKGKVKNLVTWNITVSIDYVYLWILYSFIN